MSEELLAMISVLPDDVNNDIQNMYNEIDQDLEVDKCEDCGNDSEGGMAYAQMAVANYENSFTQDLRC